MDVQSIYSNSGLSPSREPAGAWRRTITSKHEIPATVKETTVSQLGSHQTASVRTYVRLMFFFDRRIRFIARRQNDDFGGCHQWENGGHAAEYPGLKCPSATNRTQAPGDLRTHGRVKRGVVHFQIWSVPHNACLPPRRNLNSASRQQRDKHWATVDLVGKAAHIRTVPVPDWVENLRPARTQRMVDSVQAH